MTQSSNTTVRSQKPEISRTCQTYVVLFFFSLPFFSLSLFFFFDLFVCHTEASYTVTQAFQCARIHPKGLFFKIPLLCCTPFYFVHSVLVLVFILTILVCCPLLSRSDHVPKMSQLIFWSWEKRFTVQGGFFFWLVVFIFLVLRCLMGMLTSQYPRYPISEFNTNKSVSPEVQLKRVS